MTPPAGASDGESAPRPMRKDAARNRQLLLDAAREVFAERGLEASMDDVAARAGLGVGTAYRHFANKFDLAAAIFTEAVDGMIDLAERAADADDPGEGLQMFLAGVAEAQCADRGLRDVMTGFHDLEQMEQLNERMSKPLTVITERARESGALRPDAELTDVVAVVMMIGTIADVLGDVDPQLWRRYLPILSAGLRPDGTPLPHAAIADADLRRALASHKQREMGARLS